MNTELSSTGPVDFLPSIGGAGLTMSSREIADLCEKQHQHVRRDTKKMLDDLGEDASTFGHTYKDGSGREQEEYRLPQDLTLTLVAGYNVILRKRIIDRWLELEEAQRVGHVLPKTFGEALQLAAEQHMQIEAMREDVEAHDRLVKADGSLSMTEAAKNLGVRPKDFFSWLAQNGWIYKRPGGSAWLGYASHANNGDLEHKATTVLRADGTEKITEQVRVTARGLSKLAKLMPPVARQA